MAFRRSPVRSRSGPPSLFSAHKSVHWRSQAVGIRAAQLDGLSRLAAAQGRRVGTEGLERSDGGRIRRAGSAPRRGSRAEAGSTVKNCDGPATLTWVVTTAADNKASDRFRMWASTTCAHAPASATWQADAPLRPASDRRTASSPSERQAACTTVRATGC
jgi:hypothetical protein